MLMVFVLMGCSASAFVFGYVLGNIEGVSYQLRKDEDENAKNEFTAY